MEISIWNIEDVRMEWNIPQEWNGGQSSIPP